MLATRHLKVVASDNEKRTVQPPVRLPNSKYRTREYLTEREVNKLIEAAKGNRWGQRDSTMVLMAYRHGLRDSRSWLILGGCRLTSIAPPCTSVESNMAHLPRPLTGVELRALRKLQRETKSPFVFVSERGVPFTSRGFQTLVERAGKKAKLEFKAHPHMLRHTCGYKLANDGVDTRTIQSYLGHKSIQHTVRYTELSPQRFKGLFRD